MQSVKVSTIMQGLTLLVNAMSSPAAKVLLTALTNIKKPLDETDSPVDDMVGGLLIGAVEAAATSRGTVDAQE